MCVFVGFAVVWLLFCLFVWLCTKYLKFEINEEILCYTHKQSSLRVTHAQYRPSVSFPENITGDQIALSK
jgi:hypothetical protein